MDFLLEPGVVFLNHGSFGACPREVHDEYQRLQRQLEAQPVRFLQRELPGRLSAARAALARFVGANDGEIVFVPNPTFAVNEIIRSLPLRTSDEVLTSNHEYGACRNAWQFWEAKRGFSLVEQPLPLPVTSNAEIVAQFWGRVTDSTRVIMLSHITSPTALTFPVAEICQRARTHGIVTVIDGAHAPGQLDLNLEAIGADFYVGACHKWLCAPKGASFLYARQDAQALLEPLVVGWGWGEEKHYDSGSDFLDVHEWLGTHDPSAYLSVPKAIEFQHRHDWPSVRRACHALAGHAVDEAARVPGVEAVHDDPFFEQMGLIELVRGGNPLERKRAFEEKNIEVPVISWQERTFVRISVQAYNTPGDLERFLTELKNIVR